MSRRLPQAVALALAHWLAFPGLLAAQPTKVGGEIPVFDAYAYSYQSRIAADPTGNFIVTWEDGDCRLRERSFWATGNARGPSFQVFPDSFECPSSGTVDEYDGVAADAAGNFVVAFSAVDTSGGEAACSSQCIVTKHVDADGKLAPPTFVVVGRDFTPYPNQTINPELAAGGDGSFVVAWEGYDLSPEGVFARKLVSSGQINGGAFRVNENVDGYQGDEGQLDVAADEEGNFVVVWFDEDQTDPPYGGVVFRRFDKAKNPVGAQTQVAADGGDPHVARAPDGGFVVAWHDDYLGSVLARRYDATGSSLGPAFTVAASGYAPEISMSDDGTFVVVYSRASDAAGRAFDATGTAIGSEFVFLGGFNPAVASHDGGNFVVSFSRDGYVYAQRFEVVAETPLEIPLLGKVAVLKNKLPDDFERSKGAWKASGPDIVSPPRGSASDPRCNGDPEGTVKATVRFTSATSAQNVMLDLPCQNWRATGSNKVAAVAKRGYKYSDPKREDGPCNSVKIKGTKSLSVSCKGKPDAASFTYDLQPGVSQGEVTAVLQMGSIRHCAVFEPFLDGSDGKTYKGKSIAAPVACP